ncbi:phosphatidylserine decarboxylase family protein [Desulfovibrio sp. JC010]|uniref:phosphatidylserine decarboxylase family protein n=1 Tax=Desulfovibrio sp. JC010 TaxID=2593641 RepID=UPI0013D0B62D|nr:phosphatidylserine decarboxylase family protein [Desulfovibrio sp. JC010]NDV25056.1 phosphatidylserine decarboxylase family protein [Desulfovibrio sp. JC010]
MTVYRYWTKKLFILFCGLLFCLGLSVSEISASKQKTSAENSRLLPVIQEFKELIENDPKLLMLFTQMFEQVPPDSPQFKTDPDGNPQIRSYTQMLQKISEISQQAPEFNTSGLVGFPINAVLNWPMGTSAGTNAFLDSRVNSQLKKILKQWAVFLGSEDSRYVLGDDPKTGWFGRDARKAMPGFEKDFVCDPDKPYHGFKSWDDFFTRKFRKGRRPVVAPDNDAVIANSCESAPFNLAKNVKFRDQFWIKGQPYSLYHMLDGDPLAAQFEGGTIYQAFLSALSYHRWHCPVSGKIIKTKLIDGSYYAQSPTVGFDPASPNESQGYLTQVAARALIFIEADNPDIGLMAIIFVGMAEVSSNEITVYEGQHVKKGDQLGMFHFGGSTHVLIFRPGVNLEFDLRGQKPGLDTTNIPVRSRIATVR